MTKRIAIIISILIFYLLDSSGQSISLNGYVQDARTGEYLIGATITDSISMNSFGSNSYGYFSLKCQKGPVNIITRFIGYKTSRKALFLTGDTILKIQLEPQTYNLSEVIIDDRKQNLKSSGMSVSILPVSTIRKIPSLMGETDILKALHFMPGVQAGTEGTTGLFVRGGGPDQNLILLDGVIVYNPDHLFGFISVFNPDAIKNVTLLTGGFPARYGGRLSSVVDIRMKEGNNQSFHGEASLGLISSKIMLEGPVKNENTSYLISARRSWVDLFTRGILKKEELPFYYFFDVTAKLNHKFSDISRLFLSVYTGKDNISGIHTKSQYVIEGVKYNSEQKQYYGWGNITAVLRWNYIFSSRLFSNSSLTYSNYRYFDNKLIDFTKTVQSTGLVTNNKYRSDFHSGIKDLSLRSDFDYQLLKGHNLKFGIGSIFHIFTPSAHVTLENDTSNRTDQYKIAAIEPSFYIEDDMQLSSRFKINAGVRLNTFLVENKAYGSFEPRLSGRYLMTDSWAFKFAYSRMRQYIHLLTSSRITFPTDLWVSSTATVKPQMSDQYAIGSIFNLNDIIEFNIEAYYKSMQGLIEYTEGSSFLDAGSWESKIERGGKGRAFGLEFMMKKDFGRTTGWISYTLAKTERKFESINSGKWFPYKYDRRHDVSIIINHKINEKIDAGLTWEFSSGNLFTAVTNVYESYIVRGDFKNIQYFENRNNYRLPSYHRLDLGINFHRQKKVFYRTWNISVYNAYNHKNIFFVYFGNDDLHGKKGSFVLKKYTLFPVLPSLTYSLKF